MRDLYRDVGVAWGVGLNLDELHCSYDHRAAQDLEAKIRYLNALQPDVLAVLFDDMRGDVLEIAETQIDVTHRARELSTAASVIMCPTYYTDSPVLDRLFGERPKNYLETLGKRLDPAVNIFWTGPEICSAAYPVEHLQPVCERLGRKPYIWDNYPVNDSARMCRFLHLRAFENRPHEMSEWTAGHAVNPMNQAYLSQIPLRACPGTYDLFSTSWKGALARKRAEGDAEVSSRGVDAAGAPFQLALREPCVRAPVRRAALVMLQHHGGRLSCRGHEHKALKTHHTFPDGL